MALYLLTDTGSAALGRLFIGDGIALTLLLMVQAIAALRRPASKSV
jgi:hypothetical protein